MLKQMKTNSPNPYAVRLQNGIYQFETDRHLSYSCRFLDLTNDIAPVLYGNDIRIYEFSFYFENEIGNTKYDERIAATIKSLLHSFFNDDPLVHNILYYVCDYSDERQESRKLLFNRWFRNYSDVLVK